MDEHRLIFIISQPRSGSTMLQAILSNFDRIDTASEFWILLPFLSPFSSTIVSAPFDYNLSIDAFFDFVEKHGGIEQFRDEYKRFILGQYAKLETSDRNFVLDKTPRYYEIFDKIYEFFPSAKYIILKRDPVSVLNSIMKTWNRYSFSELASSHKRDIFYAPQLIQKWVDEYGERGNVTVLRYEDLIDNPGREIEKLCIWLDIEFDEKKLDYSDNKSFHGKYGDPVGVHKSSIPTKYGNLSEGSKKVKNFLNGYGDFLGKDFFEKYGYHYKEDYKDNIRFKLFRYYAFNMHLVRYSSVKNFLAKFIIKKLLREKV